LYSLHEGEEGVATTIKEAIQHPEHFVMKPQREGGGNNYYGEQVAEALQQFSSQERSAWILMDRILPPYFNTYLMRERQLLSVLATSELGIFSVFVRFDWLVAKFTVSADTTTRWC
jgi:glutathione synthase